MDNTDVITSTVLAYVREESVLDDVEKIVVGFSGGPDSTALLTILNDNFVDIEIEAVHLHHGLREDAADDDHGWCEAFCRRSNIKFSAHRLHVLENKRQGESIEMAARRLRTAYWQERLHSCNQGALAVGHHIGDKIENFLIRATRGSNSSGLTSLRSRSLVHGITIIRPLLCLTKTDVLKYLRTKGIDDYCIDLSNESDFCPRNVVRNRVLPILLQENSGEAGLIRSIDILEQDARFIENEVDRNIRQLTGRRLTTAFLSRLNFCIWSRFLRRWVFEQTGDDTPIRGTMLHNLKRNLKEESQSDPVVFNLSKRYNLRIRSGEICLEQAEQKPFAVSLNWNWRKSRSIDIPGSDIKLTSRLIEEADAETRAQPNREYFNSRFFSEELTIRTRADGDRMIPFGGTESIRVKKLISNTKLTRDEKQKLILICHSNGDIIWIPSVRRAHLGIVDRASDKEMVELEYQ